MKEAFLYKSIDATTVQCRLCSHYCKIEDGGLGRCLVRRNDGGRLVSLVWGRPLASHIDPIEKKPLFHFQPGSLSYSIAAAGCNMTCRHCQNASISQLAVDQADYFRRYLDQPIVAPEKIVAAAEANGCSSISYTYTEPTVFAEYVYDIAVPARERSLKNVLVSNGFQSPEAIDKLAPLIDGANIDLKAFSDVFYAQVCGARLAPVLKTLKAFKAAGVWLEVTTLLIPGKNDSPDELTDLARFIAAELGEETPWHVSRFHPAYRMTDRGATPPAALEQAYDIGRAAGLNHVYLGNLPGRGGEDTSCAACGADLIGRSGFMINHNRIADGRCPDCGRRLAGVFN